MKAPSWTRSVRLRLALTYSVALYVVGALVLGAIYLGLSRALDDEPITQQGMATGALPLSDGSVLLFTAEIEREVRTVESLANERALERLRRWSFGALGAMTIASVGIGWVVAGRALRPIGRITAVARDIQATDLSRRISLQGPDDELTRLADTFDATIGRLDRAFENQRRFVHEASHELRNPLATIRTNIEVALADPNADADDLRQTAEVVDRTTERMGYVVDDLLAFARSEMPERELASTDLASLCRDVTEEFRGAAEASNVAIHLDLGIVPRLRVEATELRRAVANLLSNAIEHAPSGSRVTVRVSEGDGVARIEVIDQGAGIDEADREDAFRHGWRGDQSRALRPSGSGLGLAIVRQVVEAHDGTVHIDDGPDGSGTALVAELPLGDRSSI